MSQNRDTQIIEEEFVIDLFRNKYSDFPKGKLLKTESPDFILKESARKSIGIELTKLHGPTLKKEESRALDRVNGFLTQELTKENIEFTICAKEEKLPIYQQRKLSQIWLLITADLRFNPVSFSLSNQLGTWSFNSGFQRVFLLELNSRKVFELNVLD